MRTGGQFRGESGILMDNYIIGDLTDIVRGSGGCCPDSKSSTFAEESIPLSSDPWQLPMNRSSSNSGNTDDSADVMPPSSSMDDSFGDPFSVMRDPLLHGLDSVFFNSNSSSMASPVEMTNAVNGDDVFVPNMFTRMLRMSAANDPSHSQLPVSLCSESSVVASSSLMKEIKINNGSPTLVGHLHRGDGEMNLDKSKSCLMSNSRMQILSPNNSGIKRRKSQAKKVVCIPAPAAANSRASEVVPSDLWAWRKYGQKPIKGSPYPRGYYRCSSSKGCSARKQVERSRTNPNMLVITYTSEHNHPWPTHRNALAGSRRSQPSKNSSSNAVNNLNGSQINAQVQKEATAILKEQKNETDNASSNTTATIKEEVEDAERHKDIDGVREFSTVPDEANSTDDFFADLAEIDGDPLHLLFNQGNGGDGRKESEGLDLFGIFDWPEEHNPPFEAK